MREIDSGGEMGHLRAFVQTHMQRMPTGLTNLRLSISFSYWGSTSDLPNASKISASFRIWDKYSKAGPTWRNNYWFRRQPCRINRLCGPDFPLWRWEPGNRKTRFREREYCAKLKYQSQGGLYFASISNESESSGTTIFFSAISAMP